MFPLLSAQKQGFLTLLHIYLGTCWQVRRLALVLGRCEPPGPPGRVGSTDSPSPSVSQISTCWGDVDYPPSHSLGLSGGEQAVCFVDTHGELRCNRFCQLGVLESCRDCGGICMCTAKHIWSSFPCTHLPPLGPFLYWICSE